MIVKKRKQVVTHCFSTRSFSPFLMADLKHKIKIHSVYLLRFSRIEFRKDKGDFLYLYFQANFENEEGILMIFERKKLHLTRYEKGFLFLVTL